MKTKGQDLSFSIPHAFQWELKKYFFPSLIVCQELLFFFFLILCVWVCVYVPQVIKATGWWLWEGDIVTYCFPLKSFIDAYYYVRGISWYLLLVLINIWIAFWIFVNSYLHNRLSQCFLVLMVQMDLTIWLKWKKKDHFGSCVVRQLYLWI